MPGFSPWAFYALLSLQSDNSVRTLPVRYLSSFQSVNVYTRPINLSQMAFQPTNWIIPVTTDCKEILKIFWQLWPSQNCQLTEKFALGTILWEYHSFHKNDLWIYRFVVICKISGKYWSTLYRLCCGGGKYRAHAFPSFIRYKWDISQVAGRVCMDGPAPITVNNHEQYYTESDLWFQELIKGYISRTIY